MIVILLLLICWNARSLVNQYYNASHWMRALVPAFFIGVGIPMVVELLANAVYFGSSVWIPDYKCSDFRWLS